MSTFHLRDMAIGAVGFLIFGIGIGLTIGTNGCPSSSPPAQGQQTVQRMHLVSADTVTRVGTRQLPMRTQAMSRLCKNEDSLNCAFNANVQGNEFGHSFYAERFRLLNVHGVPIADIACHAYVDRTRAQRRFIHRHHPNNCQILNW